MKLPDERVRALLDRIEGRLPALPVREVAMFGAIAVVVDGSMVVAVNKDESMLVRVDPADDAKLLRRDDATRAEMGVGRSMGTGWIRVDCHAIDDDTLDLWLHHALLRVRRGCETVTDADTR